MELRSPDWDRWRALLDAPLPRWVPARQHFAREREADVAAAVRRELSRPEIARHLTPGLRVAIGVGSRGLAGLRDLVAATVAGVREAGAEPFIVPAMGSHGGATADGQVKVLAGYGVTEAAVGAPIVSSMDAIEIGRLDSGLRVYFDRYALDADLVLPINRVKSHTSFRGPVESGLTKMLAIGFGKHVGAQAIHSLGWDAFAANLAGAQPIVLAKTPFAFGLATVENAYGEVARLEAVEAAALPARELELLALSKASMARLQLDSLDILTVFEAGKDISGLGMDPNVTGRFASDIRGDIAVRRLVLLNLSRKTGGNAIGFGLADITTTRVIEGADLDTSWINAVTSTSLPAVRLPVFMPTDRLALQLALKTCGQPDGERVRAVWVENTSHLEDLFVSEALANELADHPSFEIVGEARALPFSADDTLGWPRSAPEADPS